MIASGIGKSVFYAYFQRYSVEYPDTWIIMASFSSESKLRKVTVKKGDVYVTRKRMQKKKQALIDNTIEADEAGGHPFLVLYDGPPDMLEEDVQLVCFTRPNEAWREEASSECECTAECLYMPLWTLDELRTASDALSLDIDDGKLAARFDVFGGVARACFHPKDRVVEHHRRELQRSVSSIRRLHELKLLLLSRYRRRAVPARSLRAK